MTDIHAVDVVYRIDQHCQITVWAIMNFKFGIKDLNRVRLSDVNREVIPVEKGV